MEDLIYIGSVILGAVASGLYVNWRWHNWFKRYEAGALITVEELRVTRAALNRAQARLTYLDSQLDLFGGETLKGEGEGAVLWGAKEFAHLDKNDVANLAQNA